MWVAKTSPCIAHLLSFALFLPFVFERCFFLVANFPLFSPLRSELPYVYWNWRPFICVYICGYVYVYLCVYCVYVYVEQEYKTVAKQSMATTLESGTVSVCILS